MKQARNGVVEKLGENWGKWGIKKGGTLAAVSLWGRACAPFFINENPCFERGFREAYSYK